MYNREDGIKHCMTMRVGSQDVDFHGVIRPERLVAFMQEVADSHLRSYGVDYLTMHDRDRQAFVITRMTVEIYEDIKQYSEIKVRTWFDAGKSVNFPRSYDVVYDGRVVAAAFSNWGLIDLENEKFVRFKDHIYSRGPFEDNVELGIPERFRIPKELELEHVDTFRVRHSQTDMNRHMNNVMYIDPMWDNIPDVRNTRIKSFSIRFIHETLLDEEVEVMRSLLVDNGYYFRLESGGTVRAEGHWCL